MKLLIAFFISYLIPFQSTDLESIRLAYRKAHTSSENVQSFNRLISKVPSSKPSIAGYKAAGEVMKAKFSKGEERRTSIYNGVKALETVINKNPNDVELRLIRLSVQENLPKFIKYYQNIQSDKALIIKKYQSLDSGLKNYIKKYAAESKVFSEKERSSLK